MTYDNDRSTGEEQTDTKGTCLLRALLRAPVFGQVRPIYNSVLRTIKNDLGNLPWVDLAVAGGLIC
jgi:hypothetical protein